MAFLMGTESRTSLLIISGSWGIVNVTRFFLPAISSLFILEPFEAITIAWWAQNGPDNTRQHCGIGTHIGWYVWQKFRSWDYFP